MNIAVPGSGNGECTVHGHAVSLFDFKEFSEIIKVVQNNEGVLDGVQPTASKGTRWGRYHLCRWSGTRWNCRDRQDTLHKNWHNYQHEKSFAVRKFNSCPFQE